MSDQIDNSRRNFLKLLVAGSALAAAGMSLGVIVQTLSPPPLGISSFPTLLLVDQNGNPIKASSLPLKAHPPFSLTTPFRIPRIS